MKPGRGWEQPSSWIQLKLDTPSTVTEERLLALPFYPPGVYVWRLPKKTTGCTTAQMCPVHRILLTS
ncbi:hypothetical protein Y1Q_0006465 [Alligator mississippiensis]|uniref:Uncharacterized protein n=1 Tax=Alligator mississippiensis TaxID=8496 RepID=A0A151MVE0_ALLMI|nr:hypothetical protein Y1Q_0006465 [Alligator mississippiensis]